MTTTIKSVTSSKTLVIRSGEAYGGINLQINEPEHLSRDISVPTADLAAALGLVTREDFDKAVALSEARQTETENLRAELDQANAREAAVREAMRYSYDVRGDYYTEGGAGWLKRNLEAALDSEWDAVTADQIRAGDECAYFHNANGAPGRLYRRVKPKPPFVLPTKAHERFEATREGVRHTLQSVAFDNGGDHLIIYVSQNNLCAFTAKEVMADFTDHKIVEA